MIGDADDTPLDSEMLHMLGENQQDIAHETTHIVVAIYRVGAAIVYQLEQFNKRST